MLSDILGRYLKFYSEESGNFALLQKQLNNKDALNDRRNFNGHITASAIILSSDKKKILLIHHKAYDVWQQPGGHWEESESDPLKAARREGEEETGLKLGKNIPLDPKQPLIPFDIDSHPVPARPNKDEPAHYHHGFRYIFLAEDVKPSHQIEEVLAAGWFKLDDSRTDRIQKVIKKMQAAGILLQ